MAMADTFSRDRKRYSLVPDGPSKAATSMHTLVQKCGMNTARLLEEIDAQLYRVVLFAEFEAIPCGVPAGAAQFYQYAY